METLDHDPLGAAFECLVFYILLWFCFPPPVGVLGLWWGSHAEGRYLPLCPHQVLGGPRKPWGLTLTLTPNAACELGPGCSGVAWVALVWAPHHWRRSSVCLSLWVPWVPLPFSLQFSHGSCFFSPPRCQACSWLSVCCSFCLEHLSPFLHTAGSYLSSLSSNVTFLERPSLTFLCKVAPFFSLSVILLLCFCTLIILCNNLVYLRMRKYVYGT